MIGETAAILTYNFRRSQNNLIKMILKKIYNYHHNFVVKKLIKILNYARKGNTLIGKFIYIKKSLKQNKN